MVFSYGCVRSLSKSVLVLVLVLGARFGFAAIESRSLVQIAGATNVALTVGVPDFLPGIDVDVRKMNELASKSYGFQVQSLENSKGTAAKITEELTRLAEAAGTDGTLFVYFSGHGELGSLEAFDRTIFIKEVRNAIEKGRRKHGALQRLVFIIDACHSGSLLDPMRTAFPSASLDDDGIASSLLVEAVTREIGPSERATPYWKNLFVFASSRAAQTSLAGQNGSRFTNAFVKAFDEVSKAGGTMAELVLKTQIYTVGHNPVARFAPRELANEKVLP